MIDTNLNLNCTCLQKFWKTTSLMQVRWDGYSSGWGAGYIRILLLLSRYTSLLRLSTPFKTPLWRLKQFLVYIARWTSVISEEVCDMGSYCTRRQPSVIRAHITHFFTYHTSPRVIYSLYHNNCPICLLFVEVLPKMSIK